jgi:putative transposase
MKKPYQIESQRAVKQLEAMAAEGNPAVQMVLPLAEMVSWLRSGVGELIRQAGLHVMELLMEEEVRQVAGERSQRQPERAASRLGSERGYCVVMGQKVPIRRPRGMPGTPLKSSDPRVTHFTTPFSVWQPLT